MLPGGREVRAPLPTGGAGLEDLGPNEVRAGDTAHRHQRVGKGGDRQGAPGDGQRRFLPPGLLVEAEAPDLRCRRRPRQGSRIAPDDIEPVAELPGAGVVEGDGERGQ
jgi:hypothetical protein